MKVFEEERKRVETSQKNIKNLLDYMRASATIADIYDYVAEWEKELRKELQHKKAWTDEYEIPYAQGVVNTLKNIVGDT